MPINMKKILYFFSALILVLTSCSSDDSSSSQDDSILPKTISYTYPDFPQDNSISTITYDGNKIVSIVKLGSKTVFTYDGNRIIKQEVFDVYFNGGQFKNTEVSYTYEKEKLKTKILRDGYSTEYPDGDYIYKTVYTHTSDVLVSFIAYRVNADTQAETKSNQGNLTYKGGNLVKQQLVAEGFTETMTFNYDSKNNPLKNVTGFNLLLDEVGDFGINNNVEATRTNTHYPNSVTYKSNYIYNNKNYPIKRTSLTSGGSIELEIEYTY